MIEASTPNGRKLKLDDQNGLIEISDGTNNMHMNSSATHIWRRDNHISITDQSIHSWHNDYHVLVDNNQVKLYSGNNAVRLGPDMISITHGTNIELSVGGSTVSLTQASIDIQGTVIKLNS